VAGLGGRAGEDGGGKCKPNKTSRKSWRLPKKNYHTKVTAILSDYEMQKPYGRPRNRGKETGYAKEQYIGRLTSRRLSNFKWALVIGRAATIKKKGAFRDWLIKFPLTPVPRLTKTALEGQMITCRGHGSKEHRQGFATWGE